MMKSKHNSLRKHMRRAAGGSLAGALFALAAAHGQPQESFDVASVKRNTSLVVADSHSDISRTGIKYSNFPLKLLLMKAYQVRSYQVVGPSWLDTERYDVEAIAPEGATRGQILVMFQNLLIERFQMKLTRENRDSHGYTLVVDKNGPRLKRTEENADPRTANTVSFSSGGHIETHTVASLCNLLASFMQEPVVDMTGIKGLFDIKLDVSPDDLPGLAALRFARDPDASMPDTGPLAQEPIGASIFRAVKDLGLRLEPRLVPIECIVVEKAEKMPTPN